jgi:hypothetical protein
MRARKTDRYETALATLARHVEAQGFEVRGGFHSWYRLEVLLADLTRAYDYYELEGDVAPVRAAVEAYTEDLAHKGLRPDPWVASLVGQLLADLEGPTSWLEVRLDVAPAKPSDHLTVPGLLTVSPATLEALLRSRQAR